MRADRDVKIAVRQIKDGKAGDRNEGMNDAARALLTDYKESVVEGSREWRDSCVEVMME